MLRQKIENTIAILRDAGDAGLVACRDSYARLDNDAARTVVTLANNEIARRRKNVVTRRHCGRFIVVERS